MHKVTTACLLASILALGACNDRGDRRAEVPGVEAASGGMAQPALAAGLQLPMESVGYREDEFILSGTAVFYMAKGGGALASDGEWAVEADEGSAPYVTRAIVYRPIKAESFNGTVIVEWMNVTSGSDSSPVWIYTHNELIREGYVLISLSAQAVGVESTKAMDPSRYARLQHPGDNYSYDMFSQAGQAVWDHAEILLDGLQPQRLLGAGEKWPELPTSTPMAAGLD